MKELQYLNKYFIKYKFHFLLGIFITIVAQIFSLFTPKLVSQSFEAIQSFHSNNISSDIIKAKLIENILWIIGTTLIAGVLTLAAIFEGSQVGLISYSDQKEKIILPGKGPKQGVKIIQGIFGHKNISQKTNLTEMFNFALNLIKKRSIVIVISDFIDEGYERPFKALAQKHDLVAVQVTDPRESALPALGIIPVYDKEEGRTTWVNTAFGSFSKKIYEG